jgi:hypothetical protein
MPSTSVVYQIIQSAIGHGLRDEDFLSLYEFQARGAGLGLADTARGAGLP